MDDMITLILCMWFFNQYQREIAINRCHAMQVALQQRIRRGRASFEGRKRRRRFQYLLILFLNCSLESWLNFSISYCAQSDIWYTLETSILCIVILWTQVSTLFSDNQSPTGRRSSTIYCRPPKTTKQKGGCRRSARGCRCNSLTTNHQQSTNICRPLTTSGNHPQKVIGDWCDRPRPFMHWFLRWHADQYLLTCNIRKNFYFIWWWSLC